MAELMPRGISNDLRPPPSLETTSVDEILHGIQELLQTFGR